MIGWQGGVALSALALAPVAALGQSATWLAVPVNGTFGNSANWSGGTVPTNTATFGASTITSINTGSRTVDIFQFNAGAPAYSFTNNGTFEFTGGGIVNNSSNAPTITNNNFIQVENGSTTGNAVITNNGALTFTETSTGGTATITSNGGSTLSFTDNSSSGSATITNNNSLVQFSSNASAGTSTITVNGAGATLRFAADATGATARIIANAGTVDLSGINATLSIGSLEGAANITLGGTQVSIGGLNLSTTLSGTISDGGGTALVKIGTGTLTLTGINTYAGGTMINAGLINFASAANFGSGAITLNGGGLQWATGTTTDISGQLAPLGAGGGTLDTNGNTVTLASAISGSGGLTKAGLGTLILGGNNTYSGGTTVAAGTLQGTTSSLQGNIVNNATVAFNQAGTGTYAGNMSGTGGLLINGTGTITLAGNNSYSGGTTVSSGALIGNTASLQGNILNNALVIFNQAGSGTYGGVMSGTGGMTLQGGGTLTMSGINTYSGATTVSASNLVVNGRLASIVTLNSGSTIGGSGTIGGLVSNGATIAPGNSIGTLNVAGNFSQTGGAYVVEANAQGQADRISASGIATINGATVQVIAAPGNYGTGTTYTILSAAGGRTGTYSGVTSNFAFLTPSLSYDANNVFLTLALQGNAFSGFGGLTPNQRAVGSALDQTFANATGDYATVINALASLSTTQGPGALDAISGQQYADFGTTNVANASLFMNTLGQQMALARSGTAPGARVALAQACEVEACDDARLLSAWISGLGGLGSVQGDGNSSTLTYNVGGAAAGVDYRFDPRFLVGIGVGYTHGTQWVNSFMGQGWTDAVSIAAYGSFTQAGFYADALAGYAYSSNQMQRQILIPGLQQRTASGSTGANQFLAQVETGYKLGLWDMASVTPFARFQTSITSQNAFMESGANALNLNVAQQTTNSVRTVLGAELGSTIGSFGLSLRLGWQHEYAYTGRPVTASFAGAPSASFTVYGATPTRDAAIVGFSAMTNIAAATQLYLRYDGELGSGTDNHALTAGLRMSW
ncbi:autotransporter-associated beta strand repeat-containing protein [Rhodospirillales bacterium URHD0017]|nr:autotransporter-associated beta strand repeat-containing protein [Rhodospirillales bacterium URHD0017]